jgi:hypothetical protein
VLPAASTYTEDRFTRDVHEAAIFAAAIADAKASSASRPIRRHANRRRWGSSQLVAVTDRPRRPSPPDCPEITGQRSFGPDDDPHILGTPAGVAIGLEPTGEDPNPFADLRDCHYQASGPCG